jgi:hypothetical protein
MSTDAQILARILFGRLNNEVRRNSADKATAFHKSSLREKALLQNACRPKPLCVPCAISVKRTVLIRVHLWLKISQSKITNYAKQTQFPKKSNVYNLNKNNKLQRKMNNGLLVKTNPIKPNLVPSAVLGPIKAKLVRHSRSAENHQ